MRVKRIVKEWFQDYKEPSMFICAVSCSWKCCSEAGADNTMCQNSELVSASTVYMPDEKIYEMFASDPISYAVIIGGLEPFDQFDEVYSLIKLFRDHGEVCDFVLYTGYYPFEIKEQIEELKKLRNIVLKVGRYIPGHERHYDEVLGVELASDNQYGIRIA